MLCIERLQQVVDDDDDGGDGDVRDNVDVHE